MLYIDRKGGLRSFARKHAASLRTRSFYYLFTHARAEYVGTTNLFSLDLSKVSIIIKENPSHFVTRETPPKMFSRLVAGVSSKPLSFLRGSSSSSSSSSFSKSGRRGRRHRAPTTLRTSSSSSSSSTAWSATNATNAPEAFRDLERSLEVLAEATKGAESRGWRKVDDSWVFDPTKDDGAELMKEGKSVEDDEDDERDVKDDDVSGDISSSRSATTTTEATCVCHFIGGAFVGASPQLTYRVFLEKLARQSSCVVVATPYELSFDHLRVVDDCQFKFDRAFAKLDAGLQTLPVVSVGHSMGAHMHALINSRYELNREALVLISYNNKPATAAVPLFAEVFVPGLSAISPVLQPLAVSPLRESLRDVDMNVRSFAPEAVKEFMTVVDQLEPLLLDVSNGRKEFQPTPEEAKELIKKYYSGPNTLLIKFRDDTIDETAILASVLTEVNSGGKSSSSSSSSSSTENGGSNGVADFSVKTQPGDHISPLWQPIPTEILPESIVDSANIAFDASTTLFDSFGIRKDDPSPLGTLRGVFDEVRETVLPGADGSERKMQELENLDGLVREIGEFLRRSRT